MIDQGDVITIVVYLSCWIGLIHTCTWMSDPYTMIVDRGHIYDGPGGSQCNFNFNHGPV